MKKQENRGGLRPNSGRKPKPYKTKVITFRVREEWVGVIKKTVKDVEKELKDRVSFNGCHDCKNNKVGLDAGTWCINNCVRGSKFEAK